MEQVCGINMTTLIVSYFPVEKSHCGRGGKESTNSDRKHMLSFLCHLLSKGHRSATMT